MPRTARIEADADIPGVPFDVVLGEMAIRGFRRSETRPSPIPQHLEGRLAGALQNARAKAARATARSTSGTRGGCRRYRRADRC